MKFVCPTVTAENPHIYRQQIENVQDFAQRIHVDLMDGIFTKNKSLDISKVWLPEGLIVDFHVMYQNPESIIKDLIKLKPATVIVHAESDCNISEFAQQLHKNNIKCGVALFPETTVETTKQYLADVDQLLIFSGNLGHQGGSTADLKLLSKVEQAKNINPNLVLAWDGGVNQDNISLLAKGGIDIINAGGYIQLSTDPEKSYLELINKI